MALITALLMAVLLLILGISFLSYLENDYRFAAHQERSQEAYYLALAGLEFQRSRTDLLHPQPSGPMTLRRSLPASSPSHYFEVTVHPDGRIVSTGVVQSALLVLGRRTLMVPPGKPIREYRDETL